MLCLAFTRVLRDLFARGLRPWQATVADGHLGTWAALGEVFQDSAEQRCWNRRLTNVIVHLARKASSAAKELLHKIPYALSRAECERRRDQFAARYRQLCRQGG